MRRAVALAFTLVSLVAAALPAAAQQRLFLQKVTEILEVDSRPAAFGKVLRRFPFPAGVRANFDAVPFVGGGLIVMTTAQEPYYGLLVFDTQTGVSRAMTFPEISAMRVVGVHVGGSRVVVYGGVGVGRGVMVGDVRTGTVRTIEFANLTSPNLPVYASRADQLFVVRQLAPPPGAPSYTAVIDVIDVATGAVVRSLNTPGGLVYLNGVTSDGTRLLASGPLGGLMTLDARTGAVLASTPSTVTGQLDEGRRRVLSVGFPIGAYDIDTLASLGSAAEPQPIPGGDTYVDVDVSDQSATIFVYAAALPLYDFTPHVCIQSTLFALSAETGQLRTSADFLPQTESNCAANIVRLTEPGRVSGFSGHADGRRVSLTWEPAAEAVSYELQVGVRSGATSLTFTAVDNQLIVDGVPPGVYFVRVRGVNPQGAGAVSQELQVVVQ